MAITTSNRSTPAQRPIRAELQAGLAASGDDHAVTFAGIPRKFHAMTKAIDTEHAPVRAFVADWAFWAGDAA